MTAKILAAAPVVEKIKVNLVKRCEALKNEGINPSMCVVLVGDNPASMSYIRNKKKLCEEIGANFVLEHMAPDISAIEFLKRVKKLNEDSSVHGIIIQLPVASQLKDLDLPNLVNPNKDIDGFHGVNTQKIYSGSKDLTLLIPCTPKGIVNLLHFYGVELKGKNVVVIGVSYKANVSDTREAPAALVIEELKKQGAEVSWHDPVVGRWNGQTSCELKGFEIAIVVTKHDALSESSIKASATYIFDCTGSIKGVAGL